MASITQLTQDGRLIDDWRKINTNFTNLNNDKAEKSTTLSGYGITDAYDKTTMDEKLAEAGKVKTVNGEAPDTDGNIQITVGGHEIVDQLPSVADAEEHTVYFLDEDDDSTAIYNKAEVDNIASNLSTQINALSGGKVDYDDILTYEEISASTMLTDKDVAGAKALKDLFMVKDVSVSVSVSGNGDASVDLPTDARVDGYRVASATVSSTGNANLYMRAYNNYRVSVHNVSATATSATFVLRLFYTKL